jgi:hypothetical protein
MADPVKIEDSSPATKQAIKTVVGFDVNDNLYANVSHRTGTLESLMQIADAGDGEIAIATDVEAYVIYTGVPSVGKPYFKNGSIATVASTLNLAFVMPGATTVAGIAAITALDTNGLIDASLAHINFPPNLPYFFNGRVLYDIDIEVSTTAGTLGDNLTVSTEFRFVATGLWNAIPEAKPVTLHLNIGGTAESISRKIKVVSPALTTPPWDAIRFIYSHDGAAGTVMVGGVMLKISEFT